jgi:hypothetical protein
MPHHLPIKPFEPLREFAARYAQFRGVRLADFLRHTRILLTRSSSFESAIEMLGSVSGNDPATLLHHAFRVNKARLQEVLGQEFRRTDITVNLVRICPRCVEAEYASGGRRPFANVSCHVAWKHKHLHVCLEHGVPIMSLPKSHDDPYHLDFTSKLMGNWKGVVEAAHSPNEIVVPGYERYFGNRLVGKPAFNEVLDLMSFRSAFRTCEIIGVMELAGDRTLPKALTPEDHYEALKLGYDVLAQGYGGLRSFLEKRDRFYHSHNRKGFGYELYGNFYHHLHLYYREPEYLELTAFVSKHVFDHHATPYGFSYLGHQGAGKVQSLRSAHLEHGIGVTTLKKLLVAAGLIESGTKGTANKITVSAAEMDKVIARWKDGRTELQVCERLDISRSTVKNLVAANLITATPRQHKLDPIYSAEVIEALVARIDSVATADPNAKGMRTLKGCGLAKTFPEIISMVLDGTLEAGIVKKLGEPTKLSDLRVDASRLRAQPETRELHGHITFEILRARIKMSSDAVRQLAALLKFGHHVLLTGDGIEHHFYAESSVGPFHSEYVSFSSLSKLDAYSSDPEGLLARIKPVFDFGGHDRMYRRSDLIR